MKAIIKTSALSLLAVTLSGCGGSSSSTTDAPQQQAPTTAKFSLGLSDAPVDDAQAVYIELDSIKLINSDESAANREILIEDFTDENGEIVESIQVNLLDFQGSEQSKIIDEAQNIELTNGNYRMELNVIDSGSYVLLNKDETKHAIKVPSGRLQLGEFAVSDQAVQIDDSPAYTVEFDLRQSLVLRGNSNNNNGFIVKPQGVRIVSLSGDITGTASGDLTNLGDCTVYLYDEQATEFADIYDANDENFVAPSTAITASAPLATSKVAADGAFAIGFVQAASYKIAIHCSADTDDNVQYDALTIPYAADITPEVQTITVNSGETTTVTFE